MNKRKKKKNKKKTVKCVLKEKDVESSASRFQCNMYKYIHESMCVVYVWYMY